MEPITRIPVVQQVAERIAQMIREDNIPAGTKLPAEMELSKNMGVGRGTVREALRQLQTVGLVELRPGKGAFTASAAPVSDLSAIDWLVQNEQELQDALGVRAALEPMAARLMAQIGTPEDIQKLKAIHKDFLQAIDSHDSEKIAQLDEQFHSTIAACGGNALLGDICAQVCRGMREFRSKTFQVEQNVRNAVMPHSNILNAILVHDADQAEREMRVHIEKAQEDLISNTRGL